MRFLGGGASKAAKGAVGKQGERSWQPTNEDGEEGEEQEEGEEEEDDDDEEEGGSGRMGRKGVAVAEASSSEEEEEELILQPKKKKEQPRDRLKRLLLRNTAERRGEPDSGRAAAEIRQKRASAPQPLLGDADSAVDGPLLQVRRMILPGGVEDGEDEGEGDGDGEGEGAALPNRKGKIKIRKGGTVAGSKRTVFDDDGLPLEARFEGFAGVLQDKEGVGSAPALAPTDRVAAVKAALQERASADRERERVRVRTKHKEQKRKRKATEAEAEVAERRPGQGGGVALLGAPYEECKAMSDVDGARGGDERPPKRSKRVADEDAAAVSAASSSSLRAPMPASDDMRRDELAAERKLAILLGGK